MIYHPAKEKMWDTWMYLHEGTYYLYYLVASDEQWDGVGLATSTDGVHYSEVGTVLEKTPDATWLGSGSVWQAEDFATSGRFLCNFSEWRDGDEGRQTIFFAESTDLIHWSRVDGVEFAQDERWYKPHGRWDCICTIPRPEGGRYGYWTATPKSGPGVGFGWTQDGVNWAALEPPKMGWEHPGPMEGCELGAVEEIDGRYYMLLGTTQPYDHRVGGMWTLVAEKPEGPFRVAHHNRAVLASRERPNSYFARFFPTPDGLMVNHQSIPRDGGGAVAMAPLKRALVDDKGTLRLGWWDGNEALRGEAMPCSGEFDMERGAILEADVDIRNQYDMGVPADGSIVEVGPDGRGLALEPYTNEVDFQPIKSEVGLLPTSFSDDSVGRGVDWSGNHVLGLLVRGSMCEFYIDDILVECYSLPPEATGKFYDEKTAMFDVEWARVWKMSLE